MRNLIHSAWQIDGVPSFNKENILPKGIIEIIFSFSSSMIAAKMGSKHYDLSKCFINGFNTMPIQLSLPERQSFLGIRLQPMGIKKLLKVPASAFSDSIVDLTLVEPAFNSLWHQLADQNSFDNRISVFYNWVEKRFSNLSLQEQLINDFLNAAGKHELSVKELAASLFYSPRQLSRKLNEATGLNTEEVLLYKKYLHAVQLIHHSSLSLTEIAYESNFSDQSHFIKSFKTYTGMTPGEYHRQKSFLQGHIYENVR
jgi:AraC-like DNA-binding protein